MSAWRTFCRVCLLLSIVFCAGQQREAIALEGLIDQQMAGRRGSVVVLDIPSNKIIAAHNLKASGQVVTAPGSVIKPFVLMVLLQSGKTDPAQAVFCRRKLTIAGRRMDCTHSPAVTKLDAAEALAYSCNTYFATMAARMSPADLRQAFERDGFTAPSRLAPEEAVGSVALAPDTPHLQLQALGDWGIELTPLELLAAYRNLALLRLKNDAADADAPVLQGLEGSVQYGMAHNAQPEGITAAGKTGTAAGSANPQTHGFFGGYAPAEKPEIVLVVYLEQGRGSDAAAIAGAIFSAYSKTRRVSGAAR